MSRSEAGKYNLKSSQPEGRGELMDADLINAFLAASKNVIEQTTGKTVRRKGLNLTNSIKPTFDVVINFGITGGLKGKVVYAMSTEASLKLASAMAMGMQFQSLDDQIARSAIAELGNMITGNAMTLLSMMDKRADISPPTLVTGKNLKLLVDGVPALAVELVIDDIGELDMVVQIT